MSVMNSFAAEDVKQPFFDRHKGVDHADLTISNGMRVALGYEGTELTAEVTAVERLGAAFVGRVLEFTPADARPGGLAPGDLVRFRHRDVLRIE